MNTRTLLTVFALLFVTPWSHVQAQNTFAPDRPGLGDGAYVLQPKITYLETGLEYYEGGAIDQFSFGQVLFRHGLTPGVELRAQVNSFIIETRPLDNRSGVPDPGIGIKFDMINAPGSALRLSGMGSVSIPAGYSPFTDDQWHPSATLLANYRLSKYWGWRISSNIGYTMGPGQTSDLFKMTLTPEFTPPDSDYSLYFGYAALLMESYNQHFIEAGLTKRIAPSIRLDLNSGYDLNSGDYFLGAGASVKF